MPPALPALSPYRLTGSAWALLVLCLLVFFNTQSTVRLWAFMMGLAVAGLGTAANLVLCLRCFAKSNRQRALGYLVGLLALVLPFGMLCFALAEATRFDE